MSLSGWLEPIAVMVAVLALLLATAWLGLRWLRKALTPERLAHPDTSFHPGIQWVQISTANGKQLAAQWWPADTQEDGGPRRIAILMHGWGGNGSQLIPAAHVLHRHGWSALMPDARSHGRSEADTYSSLPRFAEDLDACLAWLPEPREVILLGHSLGAVASLLCASRRPDIAAVVSVSAFAHPEQVMRRWLAAYRIPFYPLGWLVNRYIERVIGHRFSDIAPVNTIARVQAPVLLVHGQQDDVVPLACAQQLQAAGAQATLIEVPGQHDRFDDEATLNERVTAWLTDSMRIASMTHANTGTP